MLNFERKIICLNENWKFTKQHYKTSQWEEVNLPHTWNNIDGQDGGNDYYRGSCLYMKKLFKSEIPESDEYYLEINGANSSGDVFWNDMHLAHHDGGYSCWRVQLTNWKEENTLIIQVDNSVNDSVYPQMADFTFYGGLYRDVNLICVNSTHFDLDYFGSSGIKITPHIHGNNATIEIETFITHFKENQQLRYILLDKNHQIIQTKLTSLTHLELTIEQVHLWHARKDPYLYCCVVEILDHEQVIDAVHCRFGCRTFSIDPDKGFILNGEEYPLHGVSRHQDRFQIGNALSKKHHLEDMELICEVGANTIRLAHYQHDSYFYDLCDEKGMVVWAEIPYISRHMPNGRENTISQMKELITQNYNHPSIVVWGLSNEISMKKADDPDLIENHHILNDLVHEMDPTRLTTLAVLSTCPIDSEYLHIPDVVAYNHYFGWYGGELDMYGPFFDHFHSVYPKTPIAISEYGCEALNWHNSTPMAGDYSEEYQAIYHEELIRQLFPRKYIWATYVWNMFDFGADSRNEGGENGQNHKGLVTFDRKYKKDSFYAYKAWLSDEPFVHICGKRYIDRVEDVTKVTIYSNLLEVELWVNGKFIEKKTSKDHFFYFDVKNEQESILIAKAKGCEDRSVIRKVDVFNENYRLKDQNVLLNWFDIEMPENRFSLNSKVSDILGNEEGKAYIRHLIDSIIPKQLVSNESMNDMIKMMGSFTLLRLFNMLSSVDIHLTKEELLKINHDLNQIEIK